MTDFAQAFRQGQRAASKATDARKEIDDVIKDFSDQVSLVTEGKISVKLVEDSEFTGIFIRSLNLGKLYDSTTENKDSIKWITARSSLGNEARRLAKWNRPHQGYPCLITYGGNEVRCHDRVALQRGLASMLENAWVGEQLRQLLELNTTAAQNPEEGTPPDSSATE